MARPASVRIDVHEGAVQSYIRPGGNVRNLLNDIVRDSRDNSKRLLLMGAYGSRNGNHIRSGRLHGGTNINLAKDTGPLTAVATVYNNAKHVWYFMEGTRGTITPHGPYMLVPRRVTPQYSRHSKGAGSELFAAWDARGRKGIRGFYRAKKVSGQRAKPFMLDGYRAAMATHLR